MQTREHIDLTKMAITAMMVTLVLGAMLSLFFFLYTMLSHKSTDASLIVSQTSTEKLSDLCNATNSGEMPWVTTVIQSLTEVDDPNLLYVQVIDNNSSTEVYYTFTGITLTGVDASKVRHYDLAIDECCKYLLSFSNKRCAVQYLTGNDGPDNNGLKFDCVQITILMN